MAWPYSDPYGSGDPSDGGDADWRDRVPLLNKQQVRREAAVLLAEYGAKHGVVAEPPVPVDEILEVHCHLTCVVFDFRAKLGLPDVLGAIWSGSRTVGVDPSLDTTARPSLRGRYRFTLAHELGHWRMHRRWVPPADDGDGENSRPSFVCRSADAKRPVEWQADYFAAHLLMPSPLVRAAWEAWRGNLLPVGRDELLAAAPPSSPSHLPVGGPIAIAGRRFARPLAERFEASADAMRIRLQELALLPRDERPIGAY